MGGSAFFHAADIFGRNGWGEGGEEVFAVAHFGFSDDLGENTADGEVEAAAVVACNPLGELQEVGGQSGLLVEECEDGAYAAHLGLLADGEDGTGDGALPERDADAVAGLEGVAPEVGDAVVEDVSGGVVELDFCEESAWPFEFERGFGVGLAGFLARHGLIDG